MPTPLAIGHFRAPPKPPLSSLPGLAKLASRMAEAMGTGLFAIRPAPWRITPEAPDQDGEIPEDVERKLLRLESTAGSITLLLTLDRQTVSALLDAAMGGTGAETAFEMNARPLSRIETAVVDLAHTAFGQNLATALSDFTGRPFSLFEGGDVPELDRSSGLAQFCYVSNLFTYSGEIRIVVSRAELERQILVGLVTSSGEGSVSEADARSLRDEVGKAEAILTVSLEPELLPVDVLAGLKPGKLIELTARAGSPVTLWSGGVAAFRGRLGRSNDRYAVTILPPTT